MTSRENYLVERIDRAREAPAARDQRTRRAMFLRMQARRTVSAMLEGLECPIERGIILGDLIDVAAEHRHPLIGRVETATSLNAVAADVCAIFRLPRATKNATAEQAYAKLTAAANDRSDA